MIVLATRIGDITIEDLAGMIPIFFLVCIAIMGICYIIVKAKEAENNAMPIQEMDATIVDMARPEQGSVIATWVLFESEDGNRVRVTCNGDNEYVIGDKGYLKWQGTRLIEFKRGKTVEGVHSEAEKVEQDRARCQVSREEITALMRERNIPYGEAMILAKKMRIEEETK